MDRILNDIINQLQMVDAPLATEYSIEYNYGDDGLKWLFDFVGFRESPWNVYVICECVTDHMHN